MRFRVILSLALLFINVVYVFSQDNEWDIKTDQFVIDYYGPYGNGTSNSEEPKFTHLKSNGINNKHTIYNSSLYKEVSRMIIPNLTLDSNTHRSEKIVFDILANHIPISSNGVYARDANGQKVLKEVTWGIQIGFKGTDDKDYSVILSLNDYGPSYNRKEGSSYKYELNLPDNNYPGYSPGRWIKLLNNNYSLHVQLTKYTFGGDPKYDFIGFSIKDERNAILLSLTCKGIKSITGVKLILYPGASLTICNYRILEASLYSIVKGNLEAAKNMLHQHNYLKAVEFLTKAIEQGWENYEVYFDRATAFRSSHLTASAIEDYSAALRYKETEEAFYQRGLLRMEVNDPSFKDDLARGGIKGRAVLKEIELRLGQNPNEPSSKYIASGTGFFINTLGYIATNYHVIEETNGIDVVVTHNGVSTTYSAKAIVVDKNNDLAIIKIEDNPFKNIGRLPYSIISRTRDVGVKVFAMGYPVLSSLGEEIKVTDGIISSKTGFQGDPTTYQISAPIQHGNSGGPLFDEEGYLIGITNAGVESLQNVGYAIKSSYLFNLIDSCNESIPISEGNSVKSLSFPEKIKTLSPFVVIIKVY